MSWRGPCCQQDQQVVTGFIAQGKVVVELNWASETGQSPATPTISPAKTDN